jgi:hypothetical protein
MPEIRRTCRRAGAAPGSVRSRRNREALIDLGWPMGESDGGFAANKCVENRKQGEGSGVRGRLRDARRRRCLGLLRPDY